MKSLLSSLPPALCLALLAGLAACSLDPLQEKTDIHLSTPATLDDYQQLLDGLAAGQQANAPGLLSYRSLGEYLSDTYYLTDGRYDNFFQSSPFITSVYKWDKDLFSSLTSSQGLAEWNDQYKSILTTNVVLEGLAASPAAASSPDAYNLAKGTALFTRGQLFYNLAQFWAKPYQASTAASDLGIVLRLTSDASVASTRASVQASYDQVLSDLLAAADLLPNTSAQNTQISKVRPSKAAAYGLLARTYLTMGDYPNAVKYSTLALQLYSALLDYSTLGVSKFYQVPNFHPEILYYSIDARGTVGGTFGFWNVDSTLYQSYAANDLRKSLFFNNSPFYGLLYVGDYSGSAGRAFTGIGVDELYLTRAEGYARAGSTTLALTDLNTLLVKRWKAGTFVPYTATSATDALTQILAERRKELTGRGLRWTDLRRLNPDSRFAKTLARSLHGTTYTLPPNDPRYTLQIPDYVVAAANGTIVQNP